MTHFQQEPSEGPHAIGLHAPGDIHGAVPAGQVALAGAGIGATSTFLTVIEKDEPDIAQAVDAIFKAIDHTLKLIREETRALQQLAPIDLVDFNQRKSIYALQFGRAINLLKDRHDVPAVQRRLLLDRCEELRLALEDNCCTLKIHVDAMKRVSGLISNMLQNYESDGTYGPSPAAIER